MEISTVATSEDEQADHKICLICKKQYAKYTCPKCTIGYCSLTCYKNHSEVCTRSFYQDNVVEHLKSQKVTDDEKIKMLKALQRLEEENVDIVAEMMKADDEEDEEEDEEDEEEISIAKLQSLNLDSADMDTILAMMTPAQRKEFEESVKQGKIGNWLDVWVPWWDQEEKKSLITPITNETETEDTVTKTEPSPMPKIEENLPKLSTLTSHPPSPMLAYNLIEIIYSYASVVRLFNGEWQSDSVDAASLFAALASSVGPSSIVHSSSISSIQDVVRRSLLPPLSSTSEFAISIILDVSKIIEKKSFVLASLTDIRSLLQAAETTISKQEISAKSGSTTTSKGPTKKGALMIGIQIRKIYFYLVWANEQDAQKFEHLSEKVFAEWDTQITILKQASNTPLKAPTKEVKKPVIEEI